jgi:hemerythrin
MPDTQEMIRQHAELVGLCRELDEAVQHNLKRHEIYAIMDKVCACTEHHFAEEERLMAEAGYPEIEEHKAKHRELLERTKHFRDRIDNHGYEDFHTWFTHWPFAYILAHIQYADHQIADYVSEKAKG